MDSSVLIILENVVLFVVFVASGTEARAFFVFGDSLVDSGNNNYLPTTVRADKLFFGIDLPTHRPTGRFSNGFNLADLISLELGSKPTLPYLNPNLKEKKLLVGANFASAGVGILNDTGAHFLNIIRMPKQLAYFQEYQQRLYDLIGAEETKQLVNQALFLISCGSNDFVKYFSFHVVPWSLRYGGLRNYVNLVISEYQKILQKIYEMGARKVVVTGAGPWGCVPTVLSLRSIEGECVPEVQKAVILYRQQLIQLIDNLNAQIGSPVFIVANVDKMHAPFLTNPLKFGFKTAKVACCGQGAFNGLGPCSPLSNLCPNRDKHVFWDGYHPTEKTNRIIVSQIMTGPSNYMYPMNLTTLIAMEPIP